MTLARGEVEQDDCPYFPEELKEDYGDDLDEVRARYLQEMRRQDLIGKILDLHRAQSDPRWSLVPGYRAVYVTCLESFAGCDQHPVTIFIFLTTRQSKITKVSFDLLEGTISLHMMERNQLKDRYRTSIAGITTDLRKRVADLVEDILLL